ncbi:FAD-dependent oxidoreductase [Pseudonocardia sp. CA-142604]|uniref:FAD-dependent oxidoreductase n=1 Tax=Pseudonocardia sp. CA-142604 TaxID=3240024 RepID=UPI003D89C1BD
MGLSRQHAIVIGASIAGLCAARALSEFFERVTVIDRDELPAEPVARRGVPQSRQLHFLLARGREALDELFPGMSDELIGAGAVAADMQAAVNWNFAGHRLRRAESGLIGIGVSRSLLEFTVRSRVTQLPPVTLVERCDVTDLLVDPDLRRVTGVRTRRHAEGSAGSALDADLVVDASGRGTRGATWLEARGYQRAPEERLRIQLAYQTRSYSREPEDLAADFGSVYAPYPEQTRSAAINTVAVDRFTVCLSTCGGEDLPAREEAMAEFAESIGGHDIAEIIRTATPLSEPVLMRFPESVRRHYEQLDRLPEGYLVVGDALCSFNPLYGQGMTVAALEALLLMSLLRERADDLARRFFSAASDLLDTPWNMTTSGDIQFAHVEGEPSVEMLEMEAYFQRYREAAANDAVLTGALLRVFNLLDEPSRLSEPDLKARVLQATGPATAPAS